jgi:glycyl-tRNA synthetase beta chain
MGQYYAAADGETPAVAAAIAEHYLPRFAGDALPGSPAGRALAIADKVDTLAGIFALDKRPTGSRDPFGLRRSALGLVRIIIEGGVEQELDELLSSAVKLKPVTVPDRASLAEAHYEFIVDRLRAWYLERPEIAAEMFEAVRVKRPASLLDFDRRLNAVAAFMRLDEAVSLAAANKRIGNILRQAGGGSESKLNPAMLTEVAERELHESLLDASTAIGPLLAEHNYTAALARLARLREPVDRFFDTVMVMSDDASLKRNRLALLNDVRKLFLDIADISLLSIA